jgi:hypothetical protein
MLSEALKEYPFTHPNILRPASGGKDGISSGRFPVPGCASATGPADPLLLHHSSSQVCSLLPWPHSFTITLSNYTFKRIRKYPQASNERLKSPFDRITGRRMMQGGLGFASAIYRASPRAFVDVRQFLSWHAALSGVEPERSTCNCVTEGRF